MHEHEQPSSSGSIKERMVIFRRALAKVSCLVRRRRHGRHGRQASGCNRKKTTILASLALAAACWCRPVPPAHAVTVITTKDMSLSAALVPPITLRPETSTSASEESHHHTDVTMVTTGSGNTVLLTTATTGAVAGAGYALMTTSPPNAKQQQVSEDQKLQRKNKGFTWVIPPDRREGDEPKAACTKEFHDKETKSKPPPPDYYKVEKNPEKFAQVRQANLEQVVGRAIEAEQLGPVPSRKEAEKESSKPPTKPKKDGTTETKEIRLVELLSASKIKGLQRTPKRKESPAQGTVGDAKHKHLAEQTNSPSKNPLVLADKPRIPTYNALKSNYLQTLEQQSSKAVAVTPSKSKKKTIGGMSFTLGYLESLSAATMTVSKKSNDWLPESISSVDIQTIVPSVSMYETSRVAKQKVSTEAVTESKVDVTKDGNDSVSADAMEKTKDSVASTNFAVEDLSPKVGSTDTSVVADESAEADLMAVINAAVSERYAKRPTKVSQKVPSFMQVAAEVAP